MTDFESRDDEARGLIKLSDATLGDIPDQVNGLYHAGSVGIIMSGWLGAINYGVIIANRMEKYLCE